MSYQNGEQINRYANMLKHKDKMKRNHIHSRYSSYYNFIQDMEKTMDAWELFYATHWPESAYESHCMKKEAQNRAGVKEWYEKYWQRLPDKNSPSWKRNTKHYSNKAIRRGYKEFINKFLGFDGEADDFDEVEEFNMNGPADPWFWY